MPVDLRYDRNTNILHAVIDTDFTAEEFAAALRTITRDVEFPADVPTLWDLSAIELRDFDRSVIGAFIGIRNRFPERGKAKVALLTSSDVIFGLGRMYEMMSSDLPQVMRVFRIRSEAERWLQETAPNLLGG